MKVFLDKRKWNWFDSILFLIRTIWITNIGYSIVGGTTGLVMWMLLFWASCSYILPHFFFRPGHINFLNYVITEILVTGSLFIYLSIYYEISETYGFLFLPMLTLAYACQVRPLIWLGPVLYISIFLAGTLAGDLFTDEGFLALFADTTIFYCIGLCIGRLTIVNNANKALIASIEEKNKDLEYYSKKIEELTIKEERNRVSQDLHDTVGHIFTSVITSLDALPFIYKADKTEAEKSIKEISDLTRNGLHEVRETIHQLSPISHQTFVDSVQELIADFIKYTSTDIELNIEGEVNEVGERTKFAVIRCIQEGLTNAKRHGEATFIKVIISFKQDELIVLIEDNGLGCSKLDLGFGLRSMKDRISELTGTVNFYSKLNAGMRISCHIPLAKEVSLS